MIVAIRTDKPEAEIGLFDNNNRQIDYYTWLAHRELSATILATLCDRLQAQEKTIHDITGVIVFKGPGSFTGLRIGITVANTLAYGLQVPVVGTQGDTWQQDGLQRLSQQQHDKIVLPAYGAEAHITMPKK